MAQKAPDALVLGSGVIGLTTGICLAEAGLRVLIRTAAMPANTTSAATAAMCGPAFAPPGDPTWAWEHTTVAEFTALADVPGTGVHMTRGLLAARPGTPPPPPGAEPPGLQPCTADELPDGFAYGMWATVPLVDMPRYLSYLADRFAGAGGRIAVAPVATLREAAQQAPLVANCTGIGARELVGDVAVRPVRGQHVIVENPGLNTFFLEAPFGSAWVGYMPHGDHVVLGGTATDDDWNCEPDPAMAEEIQRRCAEVEPRLANARVIGHRVGLRPQRGSVRLEAEQIDGSLCVHNYGHGGVGVTLSWGCARQAATLLMTGEFLVKQR